MPEPETEPTEHNPSIDSVLLDHMSTRRQFFEKSLSYLLAGGLFASVLTGCSLDDKSMEDSQENAGLNDLKTRLRAEKIIYTFENSTTEIPYDYAKYLGDGRGITAGRAGFTSHTGDLIKVLERYQATTPNASKVLLAYLPELKIAAKNDATEEFDGFIPAWKEASKSDPALNRAQDFVYEKLYFSPAMELSDQNGVSSALGQLIILDTIIQHGAGKDADGLPMILAQTNAQYGPADNNETAWLSGFLDIRREHLLNPADPDTRQIWRDSVDRINALSDILRTGNLGLELPLEWSVYGDSYRLDD